MVKSAHDFSSKVHLIISALIIVPVAFFYGVSPVDLLDINVKTVDEQSLMRAIMGLFLGCSILWIVGFLKEEYLKAALVSNMVFMLGIGFGRLFSIVWDGMPTIGYVAGTIFELVVGFYGVKVLTKRK